MVSVRQLGAVGLVGVVLLCGGIALIAYADPLVAGGVALVLAGLGLVVRGLIGAALESMGLGGTP